ncbi:MAG: glycosyltransferase family 1 protein [Balneolaceae bacterium]
MSRLKVALFTGNYNHIRDGVSLTLNRLVGFLLENNVDVLVFGPTIKKPDLEHNGTLIGVPSKKMPGRPEYRITTKFPDDAKQQLIAFNPDLVHVATPDLLGYKALKWALTNDIPVVSSYHTHFSSYLKYYKLTLFEPLLWRYLRWFYSKCKQIYVPTVSMAEELKSKKIDGNLKIWARGVNVQQFNPQWRSDDWRKSKGFDAEDIVITFISRLVWEKNLHLFADVLKRLQKKHKNVKALVVGDGPAGPEMKEILPHAVYTGFLKDEELAKAYASCDIFFFPSDTETFGNVTLEAMASGLPCVVADAAGSKSLVEHNQNGFLADVDRSDHFYDYIEKLIHDENLRRQMSEASFQKAKEYSWKNINSKLLGYYKEVLDQKKV